MVRSFAGLGLFTRTDFNPLTRTGAWLRFSGSCTAQHSRQDLPPSLLLTDVIHGKAGLLSCIKDPPVDSRVFLGGLSPPEDSHLRRVLHSTWVRSRSTSSDRLCLSRRSWFCLLRSCTSCWAVAWLCLSSCLSLEDSRPGLGEAGCGASGSGDSAGARRASGLWQKERIKPG